MAAVTQRTPVEIPTRLQITSADIQDTSAVQEFRNRRHRIRSVRRGTTAQKGPCSRFPVRRASTSLNRDNPRARSALQVTIATLRLKKGSPALLASIAREIPKWALFFLVPLERIRQRRAQPTQTRVRNALLAPTAMYRQQPPSAAGVYLILLQLVVRILGDADIPCGVEDAGNYVFGTKDKLPLENGNTYGAKAINKYCVSDKVSVRAPAATSRFFDSGDHVECPDTVDSGANLLVIELEAEERMGSVEMHIAPTSGTLQSARLQSTVWSRDYESGAWEKLGSLKQKSEGIFALSFEGAGKASQLAFQLLKPDRVDVQKIVVRPTSVSDEHLSGTRLPCPPGTYQDLQGQATCKECPAGSYCATPATKTPQTCPRGFYCPAGTSNFANTPCPLGYYSSGTGLTRRTDCQPCPAGKYCASRGAATPTGDCSAGFFCSGGSWLPAPLANSTNPDVSVEVDGVTTPLTAFGKPCPAGFFCITGTTAPEACPEGYSTYGEQAREEEDCIPCTPGFYCHRDAGKRPCNAGYVCYEGASTGAPVDGERGEQCAAGFYCPEGSYRMLPCPPGSKSEAGASECHPCDAGTFCPWPATAAGGQTCPIGHFCPAGSARPFPCPPGSFQQSTGASECTPCTPGNYCDMYGMTAVSKQCYAGYICGEGSAAPFNKDAVYGVDGATSGRCPQGHSCAAGATMPTPCPTGTYQVRLCAHSV
eukprot:XP_028343911.1 sushi, von Willebrand factor type A, EGF and pentraxin domain-containing protein 1-like [Physeter catodon]